MGSNNSVKDDSSENNFFVDRVRRTHSLDSTRSSFPRETYEKEVYRPSSLRDRERTRPPLSNVFETEEKRQKVQKEIEKAQKLILADALVGADGEIPMKPNDDFSEGEELEKINSWPTVQFSARSLLFNKSSWSFLAVLLYALLNPGAVFMSFVVATLCLGIVLVLNKRSTNLDGN